MPRRAGAVHPQLTKFELATGGRSVAADGALKDAARRRPDVRYGRRCRTKLRKGSLFAANICAAGELRGWSSLI
jgi:hypothetical protein